MVCSRALSLLLTRCSIKYCQANIFNQYLFLTKANMKQAIKSDLSNSSKNCDSAKNKLLCIYSHADEIENMA